MDANRLTWIESAWPLGKLEEDKNYYAPTAEVAVEHVRELVLALKTEKALRAEAEQQFRNAVTLAEDLSKQLDEQEEQQVARLNEALRKGSDLERERILTMFQHAAVYTRVRGERTDDDGYEDNASLTLEKLREKILESA